MKRNNRTLGLFSDFGVNVDPTRIRMPTPVGASPVGSFTSASQKLSPSAITATPTKPLFSEAEEDYLEKRTEYLDEQIKGLQQQKQQLKTQGQLGAVATGLEAGTAAGQIPTTDTGSGILKTLAAGASGAVGGYMVAGPPGAIAGGIIGLVSGGVNAFLSTKAAREQRRRQDTESREIKRLNEQQRRDALEMRDYNRKIAAQQNRWDSLMAINNMVNQRLATDEQLKQIFIQRAR